MEMDQAFSDEDRICVGNHVEIRHFRHLLVVPRLLEEKCGSRGPFWFRGERKAYPSLQPAIFRPDIYAQGPHQHSPEKSLLNQFILDAPTRLGGCPEPDDVVGWLCLAQHHFLPTRMLDWTESILNAACFALMYNPHKKERDGNAVIWALYPEGLNRHFVNDGPIFLLSGMHGSVLAHSAIQGKPVKDTISQHITNPQDQLALLRFYSQGAGGMENKVLAVKSAQIHERMKAQQSAFTIHSCPDCLWQSCAEKGFLWRFVIPEDCCDNLAADLWRVGVRLSAIFPDLQTLAEDLASKWRRK